VHQDLPRYAHRVEIFADSAAQHPRCIIPPGIAAPVGLMLWGAGIEDRLPPMVPIVGAATTYAVLCAVPGIGMTYVVDCYRPVSKETLTVITAAKNTFAFGLSFAVFPWIAKDGLVKVR